ncbi:MAG: signal peptidase II [Caldilineaceae bacterium]|nr:signal peptidase II [Caldilineaceae bacterium]
MTERRPVLSSIVRRTWLILLVAAIVIPLDQWTKILVRRNIEKYDYIIPFPALGEYFVFEHVYNYGAAFGILQGAGPVFIVIAAAVTMAVFYYALWHLPENQRLIRVLLGFQVGGALGNVIDRLHQGYVTDFVKVGVPGVYYWPNFNIADSSIVCSVIALAVVILYQDIQLSRRAKAEALEIGAAESSEA